MTTAPLIDKIHTAFAEVDYPTEEQLTSSFGEEADALIEEFHDKKRWQALTPEFLNQAPAGWGTALSFFLARPFVLIYRLILWLILAKNLT